MSTLITSYFEQYTDAALETVRQSLIAKRYYTSVARRLDLGEDLSDEVPILKKVGILKAKQVVDTALKDFQQEAKAVWELPEILQEMSQTKVTLSYNRLEILPRYRVLHQFHTVAGKVSVEITTAGLNFKIDIKTVRNKMAAQAAMVDLEKNLAFSRLIG